MAGAWLVFLGLAFPIVAAAQKIPTLPPKTGRKVGNLAQDFALKDLATGQVRSLKSLRGKNVAHVVFWATWCIPCMEEIPALRDAYARYRDRGLEIYGVVINLNQQPDRVLAMARQMKVNYPILYDEDGAVMSQYRVDAIPQNFLVGKDGVIRYAGNELPPDYPALLESLLGEGGSGTAAGR